MRKIILVAVDQNYGIGIHGRLPWQGLQRADMKRFIDLTTKPIGFPLIMGRKTYDSFPNRPLPGRMNIVITRRQPENLIPGCTVVNSIETAIEAAEQEGKNKAFIIGGAEIYRQMLPMADELNLTMIYHEFEANTFFPLKRLPRGFSSWEQVDVENHPADDKNRYPYSFMRFLKVPI